MVTTECPTAKIGKYRIDVQPSTEEPPQPQQRIEALTQWLMAQWTKEQIERN